MSKSSQSKKNTAPKSANKPTKLATPAPNKKINPAIIVAVLALIGVIVNALLNSRLTEKMLLPETPLPPEVKITYPRDGDEIECEEDICHITVEGTFQRIPNGQVIWILVFPQVPNSFYYPQDIHASLNNVNGTWTSPANIGIYEPEDDGKQFSIVVVVANKDAQDILEKAIGTGRKQLPQGASELDRITVTRR